MAANRAFLKVAAVLLTLAVAPLASAQQSYKAYITVGEYRTVSVDQQIGYTTGMIDTANWIIGHANDPALSATVATCLEGMGVFNISILFDTFVAGGEYNDFGGADVFLAMLDAQCGIDMVSLVTPGGRGGGGAEAAGDCVQLSTFPKGLLADLTRSGQLTVLYEEGAFC